jgi:hypothetical protein
MKARLGKAEGITATAHRIARIIYHLVVKQAPYDDNQIFQLTPQAKARRVANLQKTGAKARTSNHGRSVTCSVVIQKWSVIQESVIGGRWSEGVRGGRE